MTNADRVWNRAALEGGGDSPLPGDRALASLLRVHGLVMNGGIQHALECLEPGEVAAAAEGYAYFGLSDVASFLLGTLADPMLSIWSDETVIQTDQSYARMVPDDSYLVSRFQDVYRQQVEEFARL